MRLSRAEDTIANTLRTATATLGITAVRSLCLLRDAGSGLAAPHDDGLAVLVDGREDLASIRQHG